MTRNAIIAAALALSACTADIGASEDPTLEEAEALTLNALTLNALTLNALSANFDGTQAMVDNPLASESYDGRVPELKNQLSDALTQEFMHYLVGCALLPGQVVEYKDQLLGGLYDNAWQGELGLCPDWGKSAAGEDCQQVVSACLLSRVNAFGVSVQLSMRGHDASGSRLPLGPTENADFPWREGAFYGDIFDQTALAKDVDIFVDGDGNVIGRDGLFVEGPIYENMFACVSSVWNLPEAYMRDRICAGGGVNCAAKNVGACRFHQTFNPKFKCVWHDDPATGPGDKDYQICRDDKAPVPTSWKHAITTFLDKPCALYKDPNSTCEVTQRNKTYGPKGWDAYDAKGQGQ